MIDHSKRCTATSKQTRERCKQPSIKGGTVCRYHGGSAPQVKAKAEQRLEATKERVLEEFCKLAYSDIRKAFTEEGELVDVTKLDDTTAAALAGIEFEDIYEGFGKDRQKVGRLAKIKIADKTGALNSLARYLGLFRDKVELTGENGGPIQIHISPVEAKL